MAQPLRQAPEWDVARWFNTPQPLSIEKLRGKVIMLTAFQMLCPGCVSHALPQAERVREIFGQDDLVVLALHSVFEHHQAQTPTSLEAFLHEYRVTIPVAVDTPGEVAGMPVTMRTYAMRGTPTLLLIDRQGMLRAQTFGHVPDLRLGAELMALVGEPPAASQQAATGRETSDPSEAEGCADDKCPIPQGAEQN